MALETVTFLPREYCVNATQYRATYAPNKVYVGRSRNLRRNVFIDLEFRFKDRNQMEDFFDWWRDETDSGGRPFYAQLPLYNTDYKYYLINQFNDLTQSVDPFYIIKGRFILYQNKTLDEKTKPVTYDVHTTLVEGSKNNVVLLDAIDADGDALQFEITEESQNDAEAYIQGGSIVITPNRGYVGTDTIKYRAYDGVFYSDESTIFITTTQRQNSYFLVKAESDGSPVHYVTVDGEFVKVQENAE